MSILNDAFWPWFEVRDGCALKHKKRKTNNQNIEYKTEICPKMG
jgi:hypothetical protein